MALLWRSMVLSVLLAAHTQHANYHQDAGKEDHQPVTPIPVYRHGGKFADSYGLPLIFLGYVLTGLCIWLGADKLDSGIRVSG